MKGVVQGIHVLKSNLSVQRRSDLDCSVSVSVSLSLPLPSDHPRTHAQLHSHTIALTHPPNYRLSHSNFQIPL